MQKEVLDLNPLVKRILHYISITGVFMMAFGFLYLLQMYTIGFLFSLNKLEINGFPVSIALYSIIAIVIIRKYIKISSPYKDE